MAKEFKLKIVIDAATEKVTSGLGSVTSSLQGLGTVAIGLGGAAAAGIGAAGAAMAKLAIDAAPLGGIESAFQGIADRSGVMADEMLAALEKSSAGMVAQRDLMVSFNQAASLVSDDFATRLPEAMGLLTKAAAATGQDMDYMLDSLVRGVGRVSPLILDNLGVQMDMNQALEDYANKYGIGAVTTTVDHAEAIAGLSQDMGFLQREIATAEQTYKDANDELALASTYWAEGSVELNKFQKAVDTAGLALDKKKAKLAEMGGELGKLQGEHGKTISSTEDLTQVLTKDQQQMALYEQMVAKLTEKYGEMPDVSQSVSTSLAAMSAKFQNVKDTIGKALLPILGDLMSKGAELADVVFPLVTDFVQETLVPNLEKLGEVFGLVFDQIMSGQFDIETLKEILTTFLPKEIVERVYSLGVSISSLIEQAKPYIEMAAGWIAENVKLEDALLALGIAVGTVVVPLVLSLLSPLLTIIATFVAVTAAIALLRSAWESDWMGIRTALTEFWENTAKPALEQLWDWLQVQVPIAIETLADFWTNTLVPALETAWAFIQESILPIFENLAIWLQENIPIAIQTLSDFWNKTLLPALETIWDFIEEYVIPVMEAVADVMDAVVGLAVTVLAGLWENVLWPALEKVWLFIQDKIMPIFEDLRKQVAEDLGPKLTWLDEYVLQPLYDIFEKVWDIIKKLIDKAHEFADAIRSVELPDWLQPGSPSPFESSLVGIAESIERRTLPAIRALSGAMGNLRGLEVGGEFGLGMTPAGMISGVIGTGVEHTRANTYNLTLNVHTDRASARSVIYGFETLKALA